MSQADGLEGTVIDESQQLEAIQAEWDELSANSVDYTAANGYVYARVAWKHLATTGAELRVIVVRRDRQLICVWPMYLRRYAALTIARHLSGGTNEEYSEPLVRNDAHAAQAVAVAVNLLKSVADVVYLYNLRHPGLASNLLDSDGSYKHRALLVSNVMALRAFPDFDAWRNSKSRNFRESLRKGRKRLESKGAIGSRAVNESEAEKFVDWLFQRKLELVDSDGIADSWVRSEHSRGFYKEILETPPERSGVVGFALYLNQDLIAGCICLLSEAVEYFITGYDSEYAYYSPGALMEEELVKFAFKHRKDFDFRIMQSDHKSRWADRFDQRATYIVATGVRGRPTVFRAKIRHAVVSARKRIARSVKGLRAKERGSVAASVGDAH